jgi:hypothetical protein
MGIGPSEDMTLDGMSLLNIARGENTEIRDISVTGTYARRSLAVSQLGNNIRLNTKDYSLLFPPEVSGRPQAPALLYKLDDLKEERNIIDDNMDIAMELYERYKAFYYQYNRTGEEITLLSPKERQNNPPIPELPGHHGAPHKWGSGYRESSE